MNTEITTTDARTLLAIASGRVSDAKSQIQDAEALFNSVKIQLERARERLLTAQDAYERACEILEKQ